MERLIEFRNRGASDARKTAMRAGDFFALDATRGQQFCLIETGRQVVESDQFV